MDDMVPRVRVFTQAFTDPGELETIQQGLVRRADKLGLSLADGVFCANYHPTTKLFVCILTVTPTKGG